MSGENEKKKSFDPRFMQINVYEHDFSHCSLTPPRTIAPYIHINILYSTLWHTMSMYRLLMQKIAKKNHQASRVRYMISRLGWEFDVVDVFYGYHDSSLHKYSYGLPIFYVH